MYITIHAKRRKNATESSAQLFHGVAASASILSGQAACSGIKLTVVPRVSLCPR